MRCAYCGSENVEFAETVPTFDPIMHQRMRNIVHIQVACFECQAEYTTNNQGTIVSRYNKSLGVMGIYIRDDLTQAEIQKICYEMRLINEGDEGGEG